MTKKLVAMLLSLSMVMCLLAGCAQRNTQLPPVSGNPEPVNSPAIIQELTPHV